MQNFRLIRDGIDLEPLRRELAQHDSAWDTQQGRQQSAPAQRHTNAIPLRGLRRSRIRGRRRRDVHESRYTTLSAAFPESVAFIEAFARQREGTPGRARFARLPPGKTVFPHIDRGAYYELRNRYHLVIRSDGGSVLRAGGESVTMQEGELWWFDNKTLHDACNLSDTDRIHLIFDLLPAGAKPRERQPLPEKALATVLAAAEQHLLQEVAQAVSLYLAARRRPARWAKTLTDAGLFDAATKAPIAALARLCWPGLKQSARARCASAVAWSLALIDIQQIAPGSVAAAITRAGGIDAVHRAWREDRDQAIYTFVFKPEAESADLALPA